MYAVFKTLSLLTKEKFLIRQYEDGYSTHVIHKEPLAHISTSAKCSIDSFTILKCTRAKIWSWCLEWFI